MPVSIDSRRIRHLRAAVDEGSLTLAAATLGISQPALSMSIRSLEAELGVPLLTRHRHGVQPTAFAEILATSSRTVETELALAATRLSQLKLAAAGTVNIGCGPSESSRLLPMALVLLRRSHPDIRTIVEYGLNESLMPLVANGDIAFALSSVPRTDRVIVFLICIGGAGQSDKGWDLASTARKEVACQGSKTKCRIFLSRLAGLRRKRRHQCERHHERGHGSCKNRCVPLHSIFLLLTRRCQITRFGRRMFPEIS